MMPDSNNSFDSGYMDVMDPRESMEQDVDMDECPNKKKCMETNLLRKTKDQICIDENNTGEKRMENGIQIKTKDQINKDECLTEKKRMEAGLVRKNPDQVYMDTCLSRKKGMNTCHVKYTLAVAILWSAILGLGSGFLLAIIEQNRGQRYKAEFILTLVHFLVSVCLISQPANKSLVRVWLVMGVVWILGLAISFNQMHWMDRNDNWWMAVLCGSVAWTATVFFPLLSCNCTCWSTFLLSL